MTEASSASRVVLARYRLEERVAVGGTAEVWRARDHALGRSVAVKLLHPHLLPDEPSRARVEAEARAAARLNHPGIATVYDVAVGADEAAIVLEFVPGEPLSSLLARGPLGEHDAVDIAIQIAEALAHAHERGVVHRDVKPANVLLAAGGRVRLVDFGIARTLEDNRQRLTAVGTMVGTLRYMAPEQLAGEAGDARTDVFGLGATLYEMLAGRPAFDADNVVALMDQQRHRPPAIPGVGRGLMAVVWDALEPGRDHRLVSAAEFAARLRDWLLEHGLLERSHPFAAVPVGASGRQPLPVPAATASGSEAGHAAGGRAVNERHAREGIRAGHVRGTGAARRSAPARHVSAPALVAAGVAFVTAAVLAFALLGREFGERSGASGADRSSSAGAGAEAQTRTFRAVQDARVALINGEDAAGAGGDETLPVGRQDNFLYRSLIQFDPDWSRLGPIRKIELRLRTTSEVHASRSDTPSTRVRRNQSGSWAEGSANVPSGRNDVTWDNKPETSLDAEVSFEGPARDDEEILVDVTRLYLPLAPADLGGEGADNFGITLLAESDARAEGDEADEDEVGGDTNEFWSSETDERGPRLVVTFEPAA